MSSPFEEDLTTYQCHLWYAAQKLGAKTLESRPAKEASMSYNREEGRLNLANFFLMVRLMLNIGEDKITGCVGTVSNPCLVQGLKGTLGKHKLKGNPLQQRQIPHWLWKTYRNSVSSIQPATMTTNTTAMLSQLFQHPHTHIFLQEAQRFCQ